METKDPDKIVSDIKLLVMDVDGTLTDGAMYYSERGEEMKRFATRDGMGINLLHISGIQTAIMTSENSGIVTSRAKKLGIKHVMPGCRNKKKGIGELSENLSISLENIAYIGDDINDLEVMKTVGFCACPSDAVKSIREIADYICRNKGGNGAVRELAELILTKQNKSILLPDNW